MKPDVDEFRRFYELLTNDTPDAYEPWLFRCEKGGKAPATQFGSWKDESARLDLDEAVGWMEEGGNIGLAGTSDDQLVNVDIDDDDQTDIDDLKPTLIGRSRSRTGIHAWYLAIEDIPNIPTGDAGEVRTDWQYVVAPGSYVETDPQSVPERYRDTAGYYTVERADPIARISLDELPEVFRQQLQQGEPDEDVREEVPDVDTGESNLFRITARDVLRREFGSADPDDRFHAIWHGSETDANMSISRDGELLTCWRHSVSHNGLMALVMLSDYPKTCDAVGSGHKKSGAGSSCIPHDRERALWYAWTYAKDNGYISKDDKIPYAALLHVVREYDLAAPADIPRSKDESLPRPVYKAALTVVEGLGYDHGRHHAQEKETAQNANRGVSVDSNDSEVISWQDIREEYQDLTRQEKAPYIDAMVDHIVDDIDTLFDTATESLYRFDSDTGLFVEDATDHIRKYVYENVGGVAGTYEMRELLDRMRVINRTDLTEAQDPPGYICFGNGIYDVEHEQLLPHSPEHVFLNRWQVAYDPDASCPRWDAFLEDVLATDEDRKKVQEFVGYTLMGWDYTYQKALFIVGPTASGKSTMIRVIQQMLGDESFASVTPQQLIYNEYAPARLYAKKANFRSDIPADSIKNTGMLKEIIGGDKIWANVKYKEPFEFEPKAKHYYAANQLPKIGESDEAFFRRVMLLPVPTTVPEEQRDPHLTDKLVEELPGILNWAMEGMRRLIEQRHFTGDMSPFHTENTWQEWGNSVGRFEQIALRSGETHIPKSDIYAAYLQFCDDKNIPSESQNMMTRELKELGYTDGRARVNGIQQRVFLNVEWTDGGLEYHEDTQFRDVANQDLDYYE